MDLIKKALIINSSTPGNCGAKEDRTPDLLNAIQALSQLSYSPKFCFSCNKAKYLLIFCQFKLSNRVHLFYPLKSIVKRNIFIS